jgi:hypothetical protein
MAIFHPKKSPVFFLIWVIKTLDPDIRIRNTCLYYVVSRKVGKDGIFFNYLPSERKGK